MESSNVIINVIILFAYMLPGYILGKAKLVGKDVPKGLASILLYIASPMLTIGACMRQYNSEALINGFILSIFLAIVMLGLFFLSRWMFRSQQPDIKNVLSYAMAFGNVGYMGIPILRAAFGEEGVLYGAFIILTFNVLQWTLGVICYKKDRQPINKWKMVLNPGVISGVIGLLLFILPIEYPSQLKEAVFGLGDITSPVSMIMIGIILSDAKILELIKDWKLYIVAAIKMVIVPVVMVVVLTLLGVSSMVSGVLGISLAMPAATSTSMMALRMDGDSKYASKAVLFTVIVSMLTIPLLLYVKGKFFPYVF